MLHPLTSVELTLSEAAIDFAERHGLAIGAYWAGVRSKNPHLWNGPFFLFSAVRCDDGVLTARAHATDYATFLYWRDHGRDRSVVHITGTSLPVTADGVLLAIRMAGHTANAGQVYFPAGSLDGDDLAGGRFDVTANIRREMAEETGLTPPIDAFDAGYVACNRDNAWFVARRCKLTQSFGACARIFAAHQAETADNEIEALVAIADRSDADRLKPYARDLAMWHFDDTQWSK